MKFQSSGCSQPLHLRYTYRVYVGYLKFSHMKIIRLNKLENPTVHTSNNHPAVIEKHKIQRMQWVLSHIEYATKGRKPCFIPMKNSGHIDEKWFYLNPSKRRFYFLPAKINPYRICK